MNAGDVATCIGCGCDDLHACTNPTTRLPCAWLALDRTARVGVCTACPDFLERWNAGSRRLSTAATIRNYQQTQHSTPTI